MSIEYCHTHDEHYDSDEYRVCPSCDLDAEELAIAERVKAQLHGWRDSDEIDADYAGPRQRAYDDYGLSQKDFL